MWEKAEHVRAEREAKEQAEQEVRDAAAALLGALHERRTDEESNPTDGDFRLAAEAIAMDGDLTPAGRKVIDALLADFLGD